MIGITHTGKIGDLALCLPVCSWIYKTTGEKIVFIFPEDFPFIQRVESLLRLQPFTHDVKYCSYQVVDYRCGGQPYQFNPHDYIPDLNISKYYNMGIRDITPQYMAEHYAEEHGLGVDYDFILNLDLNFKHHTEKLMCTEVMHDFLPHFEQTDLNEDFLNALRAFAYSKERHMHFSSLAVYLSLAKIPIYLYCIVRDQMYVHLLTYDKEKTKTIDPSEYGKYFKNAPILDVRSLDENKNLISIYKEVFFK